MSYLTDEQWEEFLKNTPTYHRLVSCKTCQHYKTKHKDSGGHWVYEKTCPFFGPGRKQPPFDKPHICSFYKLKKPKPSPSSPKRKRFPRGLIKSRKRPKHIETTGRRLLEVLG